MKGIVYKVTNNENDKVYVGATTKSIGDRKKDHYKKSKKGKNYAFQNAITTYGIEAFKWEQIDTASNKNELAKKEKEYILEYNSKEGGYNSDEGGGISKKVYKYDLEGNFIDGYKCLEDAGKVIGARKQEISRACIKEKKCKEFY
jgi:group I intron endonuclease